jgi:hypothetical protein
MALIESSLAPSSEFTSQSCSIVSKNLLTSASRMKVSRVRQPPQYHAAVRLPASMGSSLCALGLFNARSGKALPSRRSRSR